MVTASIIIPSSGDLVRLELVLEAIARNRTKVPYDVWVINDGKADFHEELWTIANNRFRLNGALELNYLYLDPPTTEFRAGQSRNAGAVRAKGDYLIFLDEDCAPDSNWIDKHIKAHQNSPDVLIVGMRRMMEIELYLEYFNDIVYKNKPHAVPKSVVYRDPRLLDEYKGNDRKDYLWALTANLSINKNLFFDLGGFNENYVGWGGEDIDFGRRFEESGRKIFIDKSNWVNHLNHPPRSQSRTHEENVSLGIKDEVKPLVALRDNKAIIIS